MELQDDPDRAVDTDTGDFYYWDYDLQSWVLEEDPAEEVIENVVDEADQNDSEPSDLENTVSDLEMQVSDLEDQVLLLENEVELLSAYDAASDYNLGTTNVAIFEGLVAKVPFGQSYVYWRDGQYSYKFAYGDLTLEGTTFRGSGDITVASYDTASSSYNSYYTWSVTSDSNFVLSASNRLVYSDLGSYPGLGEREVIEYGAITAYTLFGGMLFCLFDRLCVACFRRK